MKIKKPSLSGMSCTEYLGRFKKDEFIQKGHNGTALGNRLMNKDEETGGGGGGGSPRGARGRPSGSRNIELEKPSEFEAAEQKRISSGLKRDNLVRAEGKMLKDKNIDFDRLRSLRKEINDADNEYRKDFWDAAFKKWDVKYGKTKKD